MRMRINHRQSTCNLPVSVTQEDRQIQNSSLKTPSRLRHFLPLLLCVFLFGSAEQVEVTGRVLSTYGLAVDGHPVSIYDGAGQPLSTGLTGSDGRFTLVYERQATSADQDRRAGTEQPDGFRLGQAYPNPFNPRTVVPFYAADDSRAAITVYNLLGQRVLQTEASLTRGAHEIEIRLGDNLAQGPYLLNVRGDGFSETRSMTFVSAGVGGGEPGIRIRRGVAASRSVDGAASEYSVGSERSASPGRDISLDFGASSGHIHPNTQTETPGTFLLVVEEESGFERTEIEVPADQDFAAGIINLEFALTDEQLLDIVQEGTFQYFWDGAHASGMARERIHIDEPFADLHTVTTGGSGFGLMAIITGIERGFITREEGIDRLEQIIGFLEDADRFRGVWPHWFDGRTGAVRPFSQLDDGGDLVETAFMAQGLLTVRQYLLDGTGREQDLADRIDALWRGIEWHWHTKSGAENVLYWHWSPNHGWAMNHTIRGYDEGLITYVLAASSPTHPVSAEVYHQGWARGGNIRMEGHTVYGYPLELRHNGAEQYSGPLFWAHYSYLGLDPRGLTDQYADYWEHNRSHTLIHRDYAIINPFNFAGYGRDLWGLTASYTVDGYTAHMPVQNDRGVITPTAALSSFPYAPDHVMRMMRNLYHHLGDRVWGPYGFYDALSIEHNWFPERYLAIDQGPIVVMMENHRSGLLWDLFMSAPEVQEGLQKLGFESPHFSGGD